MSDSYFKRLIAVLAMAVALALLATRCHAASFPSVRVTGALTAATVTATNTLSIGTNSITADTSSSNLPLWNNAAWPGGSGGSSTNFPIASTSTANPRYLNMQSPDNHSGPLPGFTFGGLDYYQASGFSNHVYTFGYNRGNGGAGNRINTNFWSFGWTLESSYEYTPGQLQMEWYSEFYNPSEGIAYRNQSMTIHTNYVSIGFGADQVSFGDRFGGSASPILLSLETNHATLTIYGDLVVSASPRSSAARASAGQFWANNAGSTKGAMFDIDTFGTAAISDPLVIGSNVFQFKNFKSVTLDCPINLPAGVYNSPMITLGGDLSSGWFRNNPGQWTWVSAEYPYLTLRGGALTLDASQLLAWGSGHSYTTPDVAIVRDSAGIVKVTDASSGGGKLKLLSTTATPAGATIGAGNGIFWISNAVAYVSISTDGSAVTTTKVSQ